MYPFLHSVGIAGGLRRAISCNCRLLSVARLVQFTPPTQEAMADRPPQWTATEDRYIRGAL